MEERFEAIADVYKALGDKTRLHILALLRNGELCVCELVGALNMSQPSISQHLRKLKQAGLLKERKTAQWVYYSLDLDKVSLLADIVSTLPNVAEEYKALQIQGLGTRCTTPS